MCKKKTNLKNTDVLLAGKKIWKFGYFYGKNKLSRKGGLDQLLVNYFLVKQYRSKIFILEWRRPFTVT